MTLNLEDLKAQLTQSIGGGAEKKQAAEPSTAPAPSPSFRKGSNEAEGAEASPRPPARKSRPNKYAGPCANCGSTVAEGSGLLGGKVDGKWTVVHHEGDCVESPSSDGDSKVELDSRNPYTGIYTVEDDDGHVTLKVARQDDDADFAPGEIIIERLVGRDNENDYQGFGFIKAGRLIVWKKHRNDDGPDRRYVAAARVLLADPQSVLTALNCPRCNAVLSSPDSIEAGIGPECQRKWGW